MKTFQRLAVLGNCILTLGALAQPLHALETFLPDTAKEIEAVSDTSSIEIPAGPFTIDAHPTEMVSGEWRRQSWRIAGAQNSDAIIENLYRSYDRQGFVLNFRCAAKSCGGFEFRYAVPTTLAPQFFVDLSNYSYVDMSKGAERVSIMASHVAGDSFVSQLYIEGIAEVSNLEPIVIDENLPANVTEIKTKPVVTGNDRVILNSVLFESGSSYIQSYSKQQLQAIAERLATNQLETAYIVGHSDQSGGLAGNISISQSRANQVRNTLINEFGISENRLIAKGVAFLAPIADNATEAGRAENRRVEVVYLTN